MCDKETESLASIDKLLRECDKTSTKPEGVRVTKIGEETVMMSNIATLHPSWWVDSQVISAWHALVASHSAH
eukprot:972038-Rhodomonas_salina.1